MALACSRVLYKSIQLIWLVPLNTSRLDIIYAMIRNISISLIGGRSFKMVQDVLISIFKYTNVLYLSTFDQYAILI